MAMLTVVGIFARKKKMLTEDAARQCSTFLLNVALPCVMLTSLYRPKTPAMLPGLLMTLVLGMLMHGAAAVLSKLLIKERPGQDCHTERFALVYANSAYMAIPLIRATMGEDATFYTAAFVATFLLYHWTHGIKELGGSAQISKVIKNPCICSVVLGLLIFWFEIPLPSPLVDTMKLLGGLTTPFSMIIAGIFLADLKPSQLKGFNMYYTAVLRTFILPATSLAVIAVCGVSNLFEGAYIPVVASLYCFSCPSAVSVILLSASLGKDAIYPSKLVAVTTVMSLASLPLIAAIVSLVL